MSRLIDADRALEIVHNQGVAHPNAYHLTNYATLILQEAPTIDAIPVVHCRECKHMIPQSHTRYCTVWNAVNGMGDEGFCNYGERKEGADNG